MSGKYRMLNVSLPKNVEVQIFVASEDVQNSVGETLTLVEVVATPFDPNVKLNYLNELYLKIENVVHQWALANLMESEGMIQKGE